MFKQYEVKVVGFEMGDPNDHPAQAWKKVKFNISTETSKFEVPVWVEPNVPENETFETARETLKELLTQGSAVMQGSKKRAF